MHSEFHKNAEEFSGGRSTSSLKPAQRHVFFEMFHAIPTLVYFNHGNTSTRHRKFDHFFTVQTPTKKPPKYSSDKGIPEAYISNDLEL